MCALGLGVLCMKGSLVGIFTVYSLFWLISSSSSFPTCWTETQLDGWLPGSAMSVGWRTGTPERDGRGATQIEETRAPGSASPLTEACTETQDIKPDGEVCPPWQLVNECLQLHFFHEKSQHVRKSYSSYVYIYILDRGSPDLKTILKIYMALTKNKFWSWEFSKQSITIIIN